MYNTHGKLWTTEFFKKLSCIIRTDFIEFVADKFNLNLSFDQFVNRFVLSKDKY